MAELLTFTGNVPCILHFRGAKHFTCIVLPEPRAGSTRRSVLFINGKADAKTVGNQSYTRLVGRYPSTVSGDTG